MDLRPFGDEERHHEREWNRDRRHQCQQGRDPEHHAHDADDGENRRDELAQALLDGRREVVDVIRDPAEHVAVRMAVEVAKWQPTELLLHVAAHSRHDALREPGHREALEVAEGRAQEIDECGEAEDLSQLVDVDADTRRDVHARDHGGNLAVAVFAQKFDRLGLGRAEGQALADDAVEEHVRGPAEHLGPRHHERDRSDTEEQRQRQFDPFGAEPREQAPDRSLDVLTLADLHRAAAAHSSHRPPIVMRRLLRPVGIRLSLGRADSSRAVVRDCPNPTTRPSSRTMIWSAS